MDRLIVEILPPHGPGVDKRYVFEEGKATIGRSYSNDIILDDLFVSPKHLSITRNGSGIHVMDLASENGTQVNGEMTLQSQATKVVSGIEVCIGKTRLKLVLPDHPVEPAKSMDTFWALRQYLDKRSVVIVFTLMALGLSIWMSHLGEPTDKFWKVNSFRQIMSFVVAATLYTGIFGLISYIKLRKGYFKRHLFVYSIFSSIWILYEELGSFIFFWVSEYSLLIFVKYTFHFFFLLAMFWASVKMANNFVRWTDTIKLSAVAIVFVLMTGWSAKEIQFDFSDDPSYPSHLVPYLKPLSEPELFENFLEKSGPKLYKSI